MSAPTHLATRLPGCEPLRREPASDCDAIQPEDPPKRPDPAIYSQREQLAAGSTPTWDSPDILTNWLFPTRPLDSVDVTARNESSETAAVGALVRVTVADFGIGMERSPIGSRKVDIPPGGAVDLDFPLPAEVREADDPRLGAFVDIEHPHDEVAINSAGDQVANWVRVDPGETVTATFPVRNDAPGGRTITLTPHDDVVSASVTPTSHSFGPGETVTAELTVDVPDPYTDPPNPATVIARDGAGDLVGGLTYRFYRRD